MLAFVLWLGLVVPFASGSDAPTAAALAEAPGWLAGGWLAFRLIGAVCTVPIAEELAFRGYLVRRLQATDFESVPPARFTALSFVLSSGLFGLLHGQWLAGTAAGMLFAVALYRRGRLGDAVTAHAVTNALLAAYVLATGSWSLW